MRLSADLISRFQKRYFEVFSVRLSPEDAEAELLGLAELVRIVAPKSGKNIMTMKHGEENGKSTTQPAYN
jgi:hypothetical protein